MPTLIAPKDDESHDKSDNEEESGEKSENWADHGPPITKRATEAQFRSILANIKDQQTRASVVAYVENMEKEMDGRTSGMSKKSIMTRAVRDLVNAKGEASDYKKEVGIEKVEKSKWQKLSFVLIVVVLVQLLGNFALTWVAIESTKEVRTSDNAELQTDSGETVQVKNAEFEVSARGRLTTKRNQTGYQSRRMQDEQCEADDCGSTDTSNSLITTAGSPVITLSPVPPDDARMLQAKQERRRLQEAGEGEDLPCEPFDVYYSDVESMSEVQRAIRQGAQKVSVSDEDAQEIQTVEIKSAGDLMEIPPDQDVDDLEAALGDFEDAALDYWDETEDTDGDSTSFTLTVPDDQKELAEQEGFRPVVVQPNLECRDRLRRLGFIPDRRLLAESNGTEVAPRRKLLAWFAVFAFIKFAAMAAAKAAVKIGWVAAKTLGRTVFHLAKSGYLGRGVARLTTKYGPKGVRFWKKKQEIVPQNL